MATARPPGHRPHRHRCGCQKRQRLTELQRVQGDNKRLKVAIEVKEAELKRAKMDNSCLAADFQGLKAELEEKEAELKRAKMDNSCLAVDFQGLKAELEEKEAEL